VRTGTFNFKNWWYVFQLQIHRFSRFKSAYILLFKFWQEAWLRNWKCRPPIYAIMNGCHQTFQNKITYRLLWKVPRVERSTFLLMHPIYSTTFVLQRDKAAKKYELRKHPWLNLHTQPANYTTELAYTGCARSSTISNTYCRRWSHSLQTYNLLIPLFVFLLLVVEGCFDQHSLHNNVLLTQSSSCTSFWLMAWCVTFATSVVISSANMAFSSC
jgi:hypothetical protein